MSSHIDDGSYSLRTIRYTYRLQKKSSFIRSKKGYLCMHPVETMQWSHSIKLNLEHDNLEKFDPKLGLQSFWCTNVAEKKKIYLYLQRIFVVLSRSTFDCKKYPSSTETGRMLVEIFKKMFTAWLFRSMYAPMDIEEMFINYARNVDFFFKSRKV